VAGGALDGVCAPRVDFHGEGKLTLTPLSLGDLEQQLAAAEGAGLTASLTGRTPTVLLPAAGVKVRL